MRDLITDANFPRTEDGRAYHLGTRAGELANRIIIVGTPSRAEGLAALFDPLPPTFRTTSERAFRTLTGRVRGVPVSVVSIGMGYPMVDFLVREARECVSGDMVIVRIGSCGCMLDEEVGTLVVPRASVAVCRNYDFDFGGPSSSTADGPAYRISRPMDADPGLYAAVKGALEASRPTGMKQRVLGDVVNASADSFYSSQGRQTSFPDHNATLIDDLIACVPGLATFEMETAHLFHLAQCWPREAAASAPPPTSQILGSTSAPNEPPVPDAPARNIVVAPGIGSHPPASENAPPPAPSTRSARLPALRAAAVHMVFAARRSNEFITPAGVLAAEAWASRGVLDALVQFPIDAEMLHEEKGSVWDI